MPTTTTWALRASIFESSSCTDPWMPGGGVLVHAGARRPLTSGRSAPAEAGELGRGGDDLVTLDAADHAVDLLERPDRVAGRAPGREPTGALGEALLAFALGL